MQKLCKNKHRFYALKGLVTFELFFVTLKFPFTVRPSPTNFLTCKMSQENTKVHIHFSQKKMSNLASIIQRKNVLLDFEFKIWWSKWFHRTQLFWHRSQILRLLREILWLMYGSNFSKNFLMAQLMCPGWLPLDDTPQNTWQRNRRVSAFAAF